MSQYYRSPMSAVLSDMLCCSGNRRVFCTSSQPTPWAQIIGFVDGSFSWRPASGITVDSCSAISCQAGVPAELQPQRPWSRKIEGANFCISLPWSSRDACAAQKLRADMSVCLLAFSLFQPLMQVPVHTVCAIAALLLHVQSTCCLSQV